MSNPPSDPADPGSDERYHVLLREGLAALHEALEVLDRIASEQQERDASDVLAEEG